MVRRFLVYITGEGCQHRADETELEGQITNAPSNCWDEIWEIEAESYQEAEAIAQQKLNDADRTRAQIAFSEPVPSS